MTDVEKIKLLSKIQLQTVTDNVLGYARLSLLWVSFWMP